MGPPPLLFLAAVSLFRPRPSASSFADGFLAGPSVAVVDAGRPRPPPASVFGAADDEGGDFGRPHPPPRPPPRFPAEEIFPHPPAEEPFPLAPALPEDDIDAAALLSQAYKSLTVKQLRDLLRQSNSKVSGNKRELVDRLEGILVKDKDKNSQDDSAGPPKPTPSTELTTSGRRKLLVSYNRMTLKKLKEILRQKGAKVTGNKRELVHRLEILGYENHDDQQSESLSLAPRDDDSPSGSKMDSETEGETEQWSILEPSMTSIRDSDATTKEIGESTKKYAKGMELPPLSGLLFVDKPSGWSTLPTKQQLDEPSRPTYPCLSDSVKNWLSNNPEGQQRMKRAQEEEERWWKSTLQFRSNNPKQLKKWKRIKDKQGEKLSTFEPRPAHRLDIDTSGIVCIALTPYALRAANMLFERKSRDGFADDNDREDAPNEGASLGEGGGGARNMPQGGSPPKSDDGAWGTQNGRLEDDRTPRNSGSSKSEGDAAGVRKRYVALVEGTLGNNSSQHNLTATATSGVVEHPIGKVWIDDHHEWACDTSDNGTVAFVRPREDAFDFVPGSLREAITSYRAVDWSTVQSAREDGEDGEDGDAAMLNVTRVDLTPLTGRGHQLRLHMASIGHPIVGDDMHGARAAVQNENDADPAVATSVNGGRLCLHAAGLSMGVWCTSADGGGIDDFSICRVDVESRPSF